MERPSNFAEQMAVHLAKVAAERARRLKEDQAQPKKQPEVGQIRRGPTSFHPTGSLRFNG